MEKVDLETVENELKKRWTYQYRWYRKQNDLWDKQSTFVYEILPWEELVERVALEVEQHRLPKREFFYYCSIRWYNFWSAMAIEQIFSTIDGVEPLANTKNRTKYFSLFGVSFDHKTSIFPKHFGRSLYFAQRHPEKLIIWLYKNQSSQQRQHFENRLFLLVYSKNGEHWKLKAEISWIKSIIEKYVATFDATTLNSFEFKPGKIIFSDIIWAIK